MRRLTIALAILTLGATPALAAPGPVIPLPTDFGPEGIAAGRGTTFYVGSLVDGDLIAGDVKSGTTGLLVDAPAGRMAVGLSYDAPRHRVFVAGGFTGQGYVYDAATGADLGAFTLADPTAGPTFVNDVVVTRGSAWFTDSARPVLYRIPIRPNGALGSPQVLELSGPAAGLPGDFNLNGIEATADGRTLLVAHSALEGVFLVDPTTGASTPIDLGGQTLPAADGILLEGRTLWVVQNFLNQVAEIRLSGDLSSGRLRQVITSPYFQVPTTVARFGNVLALPNAKFDLGFPFPGAGIDYEVVLVARN